MTSEEALPRLLPIVEAASQLGVPVRTLRRWATLGQVPSVKLGRRWLIDEAAMRLLVERKQTEAERV